MNGENKDEKIRLWRVEALADRLRQLTSERESGVQQPDRVGLAQKKLVLAQLMNVLVEVIYHEDKK